MERRGEAKYDYIVKSMIIKNKSRIIVTKWGKNSLKTVTATDNILRGITKYNGRINLNKGWNSPRFTR